MSKIQEIEKRWAAAPKGPWFIEENAESYWATKLPVDLAIIGNETDEFIAMPSIIPDCTRIAAVINAPSDVAYLLGEVKRLNQAIIRTIEWAKTTGEAKEAEQETAEICHPFNHSDEPRGYARACEDVAEMLGEALRPEEAAQ